MPPRVSSALLQLAGERLERDGRHLVTQRVVADPVFRPAHRRRETLGARIGLALVPVLRQSKHHQLVLLDEVVLAGVDRIRRRGAGGAAAAAGCGGGTTDGGIGGAGGMGADAPVPGPLALAG